VIARPTPITEAALQRAIVQYLDAVLLPSYRAFAIPNAAPRTRTGHASNAVAGLRKGVPDLAIVGGSKVYFIEVKTPRGVLSDEQSEFGVWCVTKAFVGWACCRSLDDVKTALAHWNIETREVS